MPPAVRRSPSATTSPAASPGWEPQGGPHGQRDADKVGGRGRAIATTTTCCPSQTGVSLLASATDVGCTRRTTGSRKRFSGNIGDSSWPVSGIRLDVWWRATDNHVKRTKNQEASSTCAKSVAPLRLHPPPAVPTPALPRPSSPHFLRSSISQPPPQFNTPHPCPPPLTVKHHLKAVQCTPSAAPCRTP